MENLSENAIPWLLMGDFNLMASVSERSGDSYRSWNDSKLLRAFISKLSLINPPLKGRSYTWRTNSAQARLDRFLFNLTWSQKFPNYNQTSLTNTCSDHNPILHQTNSNFPIHNTFRFENSWLTNKEAHSIITDHLQSVTASNLQEFYKKLTDLGGKLRDWNKDCKRKTRKHKENINKIINWIENKEEKEKLSDLEKWETIHKNKADVLFKYYKNLIGAEPPQQTLNSSFDVKKKFQGSQQDLEILNQELKIEEMDAIVKKWKNNKSPGPDGFNRKFLKKYWSLMREEVQGLQANSPHQLAHKANHLKSPLLCFKVDIEKTFDTIYWDFVITVLKARGFKGWWLDWIKEYVLKGAAKILLNGLPGKSIHMKRGVRQGDPLSPHLFIIAMDTLARVAETFSRENFLEKPIPNINISLFYADDSIFLIKPEIQQVKRLKFLLQTFANSSGLKINYQKSAFCTLPENHPDAEIISSELGCPQASMPLRYLGYPLHFKKPTKAEFRKIIEKFETRLQGWQKYFTKYWGKIGFN
ncbi:hypothetical protein LUZ60_000546 [Juncus effusus]|nr:hypothetical protein LUZ60_000546 [Juncus effusus]